MIYELLIDRQTFTGYFRNQSSHQAVSIRTVHMKIYSKYTWAAQEELLCNYNLYKTG